MCSVRSTTSLVAPAQAQAQTLSCTDLQLCMLHGVQDYTAKLASLQAKGDDYEIAAAQIGVEVYSALNAAVA